MKTISEPLTDGERPAAVSYHNETLITTDFDALRPDSGNEKDFQVENNPYAFSPGQLNKMLNPKSLAAFHAVGRLRSLEKGLRSGLVTGLSADENYQEGSVSFPDALSKASGAVQPNHNQSPLATDSCNNRERVLFENRSLQRKIRSPLLDLWRAYNEKILISLSVAALVSLAVGIYETTNAISLDDQDARITRVKGLTIASTISIFLLVCTWNSYGKNYMALRNESNPERKTWMDFLYILVVAVMMAVVSRSGSLLLGLGILAATATTGMFTGNMLMAATTDMFKKNMLMAATTDMFKKNMVLKSATTWILRANHRTRLLKTPSHVGTRAPKKRFGKSDQESGAPSRYHSTAGAPRSGSPSLSLFLSNLISFTSVSLLAPITTAMEPVSNPTLTSTLEGPSTNTLTAVLSSSTEIEQPQGLNLKEMGWTMAVEMIMFLANLVLAALVITICYLVYLRFCAPTLRNAKKFDKSRKVGLVFMLCLFAAYYNICQDPRSSWGLLLGVFVSSAGLTYVWVSRIANRFNFGLIFAVVVLSVGFCTTFGVIQLLPIAPGGPASEPANDTKPKPGLTWDVASFPCVAFVSVMFEVLLLCIRRIVDAKDELDMESQAISQAELDPFSEIDTGTSSRSKQQQTFRLFRRSRTSNNQPSSENLDSQDPNSSSNHVYEDSDHLTWLQPALLGQTGHFSYHGEIERQVWADRPS
ncbi:uncharacterized protein A1O9_04174 [Exophiala aquamarina CBS 119918]|uniref:Uncharacterized protein n=1 Tax=Exophiala aquamarina CBS 119918 TaxID=1182545 RepID=A0A072PUY2_9EURO|nr:uncharacterized protein A1O9_04174 [Exophiala aquamarina CBS 119918]KEF59330.1 hypothetical protein A1O9_04174 [Exophiala aquamarina CBS 119918]